ncbi:alpha/beta fold hydrolase [Hydrogenophaga sp.]|uniref:alpha/beta hydrolase family protein n=1 Tax=Hydrogenophaga sp. TaxID=1904254 RepID=UPI0035695F6D
MRSLAIVADGGARIALRVFEPAGAERGSVVIGGAMGVRQDYYAPFAQWLAGQGWRVTTFDYRGSGDSRPDTPGGGLRGYRADLFDWARDYEAAIDHAHAALPERPLYLLGHSLGAQLPGLLRNPHKVKGLLSVAAGSGYWRENAPKLKRMVPYFWYLLVPLATRLFGYFPGRQLRKVGDLPKGVMLQWRRWCLNPRYSVGAEGEHARLAYARVRYPVLALSITDDELMTRQGTESLFKLYENASCELHDLAPADCSVRRIGHFGAFRSEHQAVLWPRLQQWLASGLVAQETA